MAFADLWGIRVQNRTDGAKRTVSTSGTLMVLVGRPRGQEMLIAGDIGGTKTDWLITRSKLVRQRAHWLRRKFRQRLLSQLAGHGLRNSILK